VLVASVALAVAIGAGCFDGTPAPEPGTTSSRPDGQEATVVRVADGDTITVEFDGREERVRYVGIDAPEVANQRAATPEECGGEAAQRANADLVSGRTVVLEADVSDRDRFGRLLRHAWVADDGAWILVSERLVAIGAAEARSYPPDMGRDAQLVAAERAARDAGRGIWGDC
jgi:micrococcal nuclease